MKAIGERDYARFKTKFTTKLQQSTAAGKSCKHILIRIEKAADKRKSLKIEKEQVLGWKEDANKKRTIWILKIMKLFYFNLKPVDFANEDSYLYFVLSPIFKSLFLDDDLICLLFGESNLKAKANEINRYLGDEERRFTDPKIDIIV